jgi:hypothetical protein
MGAPDRLKEIWYQSFNQLEIASALVGATRESCRKYFSHFLRRWAHRKAAFDDLIMPLLRLPIFSKNQLTACCSVVVTKANTRIDLDKGPLAGDLALQSDRTVEPSLAGEFQL